MHGYSIDRTAKWLIHAAEARPPAASCIVIAENGAACVTLSTTGKNNRENQHFQQNPAVTCDPYSGEHVTHARR
jgi:hypothetical protein